MKIRTFALLSCIYAGSLFSADSLVNNKGVPNPNHIDLVVPPDVWQNTGNNSNSNNNNPCTRCCIYQNHTYSEGAVMKVDGEILQCVRDQNVVGTNPLIWQRMPK